MWSNYYSPAGSLRYELSSIATHSRSGGRLQEGEVGDGNEINASRSSWPVQRSPRPARLFWRAGEAVA